MLRLGRARLDLSTRTLMMIDSLEMSDADREIIVRNCVQCKEACIVITHGTDTMVETARALQGIAGKVIVLTGALNPALFKGSDAVFNIGCAVGAVQSLQLLKFAGASSARSINPVTRDDFTVGRG
jgi:L-asparaginase